MLVLSRFCEQSLMIGDTIEIRVLRVLDGKVRLGITAPRGVSVHRREVYDAIQLEKKLVDEVQDTRDEINEAGK